MDSPDDHGHYGHPGSHKGRTSSSHAAAERVRRASQAVQARVLANFKQQQEAETSTHELPAQSQERAYPYDRPKVQPAASLAQDTSMRAILEQAKQAAKDAPGVSQAVAQREKEANMLRGWFQAVWPDLGAFKAWGSATKVASMSGSLTLSLAFFGVVYWMSTRYERQPDKQQRESKAGS